MVKRILMLVLACLSFSTLFPAILESTLHGTLVVEVISIDKEGVTFRSRLGTTLVKAEYVRYVLMDEKRAELVGTKGICLTNGSIVHGIPDRITRDSGVIMNRYGTVRVTLDDIVYFTYDNCPPSLETVMTNLNKVSFSRMIYSINDLLQVPIVTLVNGTCIRADSINIQQQNDRAVFRIESKGIAYILSPGYILFIELPKRFLGSHSFVIRLVDGSYIVGNPNISEKSTVITTPFGDTVVVPTASIFGIYEASAFLQRTMIVRVSQFQPLVNFSYEKDTATLNIEILADILLVGGNPVDSVDLPVIK